jgi:predicted dithiol-disulfide oxidoreductase (DUF899 family)
MRLEEAVCLAATQVLQQALTVYQYMLAQQAAEDCLDCKAVAEGLSEHCND